MILSASPTVDRELTPEHRAEIAAMAPRDLTLRLYFSWSTVLGGFSAQVTHPEPGKGLLGDTRGHPSPIDAARAVARIVARRPIEGPHPLDRFLVHEPIGRLSQGEPEPVE